MATEQTPLEPDLREPRRRSREFNALLWLGGWGGAAAIALTALAIASQTKTAGDRLRQVFAINEPAAIAQMPPRVTQLESDVLLLTAQVRALTVERDRLAGRIALLESSIDDMTGAIKRQAAATAAALAAKTTPPAPSAPATTAPSAAANASPAAPTTPPPIAAAEGYTNQRRCTFAADACCRSIGERPCTTCHQPKRIWTRSRRRCDFGWYPPALDHCESQFWPSVKRHVSARRP